MQLIAKYTHKFHRLQTRYGGYIVGVEPDHQIGRLLVEIRQIAPNPCICLSLPIKVRHREFSITLSPRTRKRRPYVMLKRRRPRSSSSNDLCELSFLDRSVVRRTFRDSKEDFKKAGDGKDGGSTLSGVRYKDDPKRKRGRPASKALTRDASSQQSAVTTSAPCDWRAFALSLLALRVMARTFQPSSFRNSVATLPPWAPVAPMMAMILLMVGNSKWFSKD